MSTQTLNLNPSLYQYYREHAFREPEILSKLRVYTHEKFSAMAKMQISPEQGQFMQFLITVMQAKKILEIGTFTGYSSLWMALALPENGKIVTCDIDSETTSIARNFWRQAQVEQKIELKLGKAATTLENMLREGYKNFFDFVFIDADKIGYDQYYEQCLLLVRSGGVIAIDNTLLNGKVAEPDQNNPSTLALRDLNNKLLRDQRISLSMLPISDGLSLAYKY